jgi:hypothetical protein
MKDQLMAKFAGFRARMRQWERRINDEDLAERDNFLKWVEPAFRGCEGRAPLDDPRGDTGRKRKNEPGDCPVDAATAGSGPVKRRRSVSYDSHTCIMQN